VAGALLQAMGVLAFFPSSYLLILFYRACFAFGTAIIVPVATAIVAEWFGTRRLPFINGIIMSCINLANGITYATAIPIANAFSWNTPMAVYGLVALACAVAWIILGKNRDKEPVSIRTDTTDLPENRPDFSLRQVLANRSAILLTMAVFVSWALGNAIFSWLPDYYYNVFNISLEKASRIMVFSTVGGTIASIAGGILATRTGRRRPFLIISGFGTALSALLAISFNNIPLIYISVTLFGIFGGINASSIFTIPMEIPEMSVLSGVVVISMMQVGGNLGNFISPLVVGYFVDLTGSYMTGFITFIVLSFGQVIAGIMLPETGPAGRKEAVPGAIKAG